MSQITYRQNPTETFYSANTPLTEQLRLRSVADAMEHICGLALRVTPHRETVEVSAPNGDKFFLKRYFSIKACRDERRALTRIMGANISTPELLAWGEAKKYGAFLLLRRVNGRPLDNVVAEEFSKQNKKLLIVAVADLVAELHRHEFVHHDLYLCHIFYEPQASNPIRLHLIDLQRLKKRRLKRWFVKDLAALAYSCPKTVSRSEQLRFLRRYMQQVKSKARMRPLIRAILRKVKKIAAHQPKYI